MPPASASTHGESPLDEAQAPPPGTPDGLWARVLEAAGSKQMRALLGSLRPLDISAARAVVACDGPMRRMVEARLGEIEGILRQVCPAARLELAPAENGARGEARPPAAAQGPADEPEIVRLAADLFGARVVNVQRKDRSNGDE